MMTVLRDRNEIDAVIAEAEAIEQGGDPADVAGGGGPAPGASKSGAEGASPSASPAPASFTEVARFALLVIDGGFCLAFGKGSQLPDELRPEAQQNLEVICAKYLPRLMGEVGPELALLGILGIHAFNLSQRPWPTTVPAPESSANAEAANRL